MEEEINNEVIKDVEKEKPYMMLFGGCGFLGQGLKKLLRKHSISYIDVDINSEFPLDIMNEMDRRIIAQKMENVSTVIILAAKVGVDIFESDPKNAADYNTYIYNWVLNIINCASELFNKKYNVVFYSTSEVYGSLTNKTDIITYNTPFKISNRLDRSLYAKTKMDAEKLYFSHLMSNTSIESLKIIRPFNVFGPGQKRGVVYNMIKDKILKGMISYNTDTTRTMTPIDYFSEKSLEFILKEASGYIPGIKFDVMNISDNRLSMEMGTLASVINRILGEKYDLFYDDPKQGDRALYASNPPDKFIQYRVTSPLSTDMNNIEEIMHPTIIALAEEIYNDVSEVPCGGTL